MDGHERSDVVEDRAKFLKYMKDLEPYLVEFEEDGTMKTKTYPKDCQVGGEIRRPIICITHDECTFSANDGRKFAWQMSGDTPLRPKRKGRGIMISDFLFPFGRLRISHLSNEGQNLFQTATGLAEREAVEIFEYGKNNDGYWDGPKLLKQVIEKAIPIADALYPGYSLLFMFDNATSHAVYAKDALCTGGMNKGSGGNQPLLRDGWFEVNGQRHPHQMLYLTQDGLPTPKGIQQILEERNLWPESGLKLECPKPKCYNCQRMAECKICVKGSQCEGCKGPKTHSAPCSQGRKCDACVQRKASCQCLAKQYCATCSSKRGKCMDCEELPPRCTSNGNLILIPYS